MSTCTLSAVLTFKVDGYFVEPSFRHCARGTFTITYDVWAHNPDDSARFMRVNSHSLHLGTCTSTHTTTQATQDKGAGAGTTIPDMGLGMGLCG